MGFSSVWHWVIVLAIVVLLFGAKKIPELAKGLGSGIRNFKKELGDDEKKEESTEQKTSISQSENVNLNKDSIKTDDKTMKA